MLKGGFCAMGFAENQVVIFVLMEMREKDYLTKKELDTLFKDKRINETQIWVKTKVKELPKFLVNMALGLTKLSYIKYIQLCDELLTASNMNYPNRPHVPKLIPHIRIDQEQPLGIEILYDLDFKQISFQDLHVNESRNEEIQAFEMLDAIMKELPLEYSAVHDLWWSEEFSEAVRKRYPNYKGNEL